MVSRKDLKVFAFFATIVLAVDIASAGLLQSIRDAAFLKDSLSGETPRDSRALPLPRLVPQDEFPGNQGQEPSFFDQYYQTVPQEPQAQAVPQAPCRPGDFLCLAQRNMKTTLGSEMSNAIVKSVATLMTDMLNTTIARSFDLMAHAAKSPDAQKEAEARAAINMVGNAISTVSSKVIQGVASFVKVSMSGAMWDLFHQVVGAATKSFEGVDTNANDNAARFNEKGMYKVKLPSFKPIENMGTAATGQSDPVLVTPSNLNDNIQLQTNEIKRSSNVSVE